MQQQMTDSRAIFVRRFPMILIGVFAAAALALTLIALYAICMHEVVTRRREFGIRLALGSSPGLVRRLILSDAVRVGAVGIIVGASVAVLVSRSMQTVLYGIPATDWRVYGSAALVVLSAAILATLGPAVRAGAVNPSVVMRGE
jgi:ABC-type antimicrobial peptide transport system permease subunit